MRRSLGRRVLAVMFAALALIAWAQAVLVPLGRSDDPLALTAFQTAIGFAGALAAWGCWSGARWAPVAAVAYGGVTAAMLMALPVLLDLDADARTGIWTGAAGVGRGSLLIAWYLRRLLRSDAASARRDVTSDTDGS